MLLHVYILATFRLQAKVAQIRFFCPYVTQIWFWSDLWTAQITWNLIFSILIWATFICGPKSDTDLIFSSVTSVWTVISEFMRLLRHFGSIPCCSVSCSESLEEWRWQREALTDIVRSHTWHPEILDEICFYEAIHVTIPPLLALTPHSPTAPYTSISHCSTQSHN